jgi:hypothetical protein
VHDEGVDAAKEGLGGAVAPGLSAQGTDHGDGLEWELVKAGGDIAPARLARDHESLAIRWSLEHGDSIGEYKTKVKWIKAGLRDQGAEGEKAATRTQLAY